MSTSWYTFTLNNKDLHGKHYKPIKISPFCFTNIQIQNTY